MHNLTLLIFLFLSGMSLAQEFAPVSSPADHVNPFIGTAGGGNTFPGAVRPWGMVSVSPHTALTSPSGYLHGQSRLYGFGHVQFSGTGCAELGSIRIMIVPDSLPSNPSTYYSSFQNEHANPGYYSVELLNLGILAEMSSTVRTGIIKFTVSKTGTYFILINVGTSLGLRGGGAVNFDREQAVSGYNISGGFCGEVNREKIYFYSEISKNFVDYGTWIGEKKDHNKFAKIADKAVGGWVKVDLKAGDSVLVKTGISYVSKKNARLNLQTEQPGWDFDPIRMGSWNAWNMELSRIQVQSNSVDNVKKFYTALYHCLIHPNIISDVNGEYPLMGQHGIGRYPERLRYSVFSLWDTYRTLHPLLTLVYPERQLGMIRTMLDMYDENGYLPKWELAGIETYMMVGDPSSIVIADSYVKNLRKFDADKALEAMLKSALLKTGKKAPPIRAAYHYILEYGFIPFDQNMNDEWWAWGPVSTSLEYNLADWSIARMATLLGQNDISSEFFKRANYYKNLFDNETGFMRPRLKNGDWLTPFDSLATEGSGDWLGSGGPGYVEGNAWNYTFFVPHDIPGLVGLFGGEKKFTDKLLRCFSSDHFTITNEPDIAYPYLFTYVKGYEHHTSRLVKKLMDQHFGVGPDGLPGNDDCGAISAWFVFSALGIYPSCPASEHYQLGIPMFDHITVLLDQQYYTAPFFKIETNNADSGSNNIEEIKINGIKRDEFQISHYTITDGTKIQFRLK